MTTTPNSWRTGSKSGDGHGGNCVEVGAHRSSIAVRDTKNRSGGSLSIDTPEWSGLIASIKDGSL